MSNLKKLQAELKKLANPKKAEFLKGFFKTGKGEYAEGDKLLGITVPAQRAVAKKFYGLPLGDIETLLRSPWHEHRLTGLFLLVNAYERGDAAGKKRALACYLSNLKGVNNWDLVDSSAHLILGASMLTGSRKRLYTFARSKDLWKRRIAIVATLAFIRNDDFGDTVKISELLLQDRHDLIHKASGWMLREAGKRDASVLLGFLDKHHKAMPRTMLRYALERLPAATRAKYMKK